MRDVWLFEGFGFTNDYSKHGFKLRQNYMYIQERGAEMNAKKTCELYGVIKTDFGFWKYLMQLSFYQSGSKFRCRNNKISVMFDKNVDVVVDEILCPFMKHYWGAIMGAMASQITSLTIVYSTVHSGTDQRKHQSSASLAFVCGIHRRPVNSPHKWSVTRKMFPFDDVIMDDVIGDEYHHSMICENFKEERNRLIAETCTWNPQMHSMFYIFRRNN